EEALFGAAAEAVEGAQGHVLLVGDAARRVLEFLTRQPEQAAGEPLPEFLRPVPVPALQGLEPVGDRPLRRHGRSFRARPAGRDRAASLRFRCGGQPPRGIVTPARGRIHRARADSVTSVAQPARVCGLPQQKARTEYALPGCRPSCGRPGRNTPRSRTGTAWGACPQWPFPWVAPVRLA